jgi:hypothetical protein
MPEGYLSTHPGSNGYVIDNTDGLAITDGQAIEIFVGGYWIPGHIASSSTASRPSLTENTNRAPQHYGAYIITSNSVEDTVMEASEESFPASDAPAWTTTPHTSPSVVTSTSILDGYYFSASADGSICGLCLGMKVRTK